MSPLARQTLLLLAGVGLLLGAVAAWSVGGSSAGAQSTRTNTTLGSSDLVLTEVGPAAEAVDSDSVDSDRGDDSGGDDGSLPPADGVPTLDPPAPVPVELRIAGLGIDEGRVVPVGVDPAGELAVPGATEVGWYRFGPSPGDRDSVVLAAHIAYNGVDGVFRELESVEPGSVVDVTLDDGTTRYYRIDDVITYPKSELPVDNLFSETGPERLVLITCGGDFNPGLRSYDANVVALASPLD